MKKNWKMVIAQAAVMHAYVVHTNQRLYQCPLRLESILLGTPLCNASCADQMSNTLTVHIRARFTNFSAEWLELNSQVPTAGLLKAFMDHAEASGLPEAELGARLSKFFMERLTLLFTLWQEPELLDALAPPPANDSDPAATRQQRLVALLHQPHVLQQPALVREFVGHVLLL